MGNWGKNRPPDIEDIGYIGIFYPISEPTRLPTCHEGGKLHDIPTIGNSSFPATNLMLAMCSKWWFQAFSIFTPTWGSDPI